MGVARVSSQIPNRGGEYPVRGVNSGKSPSRTKPSLHYGDTGEIVFKVPTISGIHQSGGSHVNSSPRGKLWRWLADANIETEREELERYC